ncbi:hypothetical protein AMECASPLE_037829 [Ameca splendens]|uniref:Uncharacterized protein n=1 Tax=Ameca splendens TaxID=208324 RepID=A0ABV0YWE4_9TELE
MPSVKYGEGSVILWAFFCSEGPGNHELFEIPGHQIFNPILVNSPKKHGKGCHYDFQPDSNPKEYAQINQNCFNRTENHLSSPGVFPRPKSCRNLCCLNSTTSIEDSRA